MEIIDMFAKLSLAFLLTVFSLFVIGPSIKDAFKINTISGIMVLSFWIVIIWAVLHFLVYIFEVI